MSSGYGFGDVVLVLFPFTNQGAAKKRPAVIVSSNTYNRSKPDVILMAITSQLRPMLTLGEVLVKQWQEAGLLRTSTIKPVFATLENALIIRQLGVLTPDDQSALRKAIAEILR